MKNKLGLVPIGKHPDDDSVLITHLKAQNSI